MKAALLPLIVLVSCAGGQSPAAGPVASGPVRVVIDESWLGYAICETRPTGWIRIDVVDSPEGPQVLAHERAHTDFIASFPSCAAYLRWRAVPGNRAIFEAHGHCAGATTDAATGRVGSLDAAIRMHAARLAYGYPYGLSEAEAESMIRRFCDAP